MLNRIWSAFFLLAFASALINYGYLGNNHIFSDLMQALFAAAKSAFEIALGLTGVLTLWLGFMRIAEQSGAMQLLARSLNPLLSRLMPEVPADHPALGAMLMNLSANALGLDNAATPLGIKAMQHLQTLNPSADTASNAQILFLVLNASSVTLFPISIFTYRAQMGAINPTDVFIPILLATYISTMAGLLAVAWIQKIQLWDKVILSYLLGFSVLVGILATYFCRLPQAEMLQQSALLSNGILFTLLISFIVGAIYQRIDAYAAFIEGAREGFQTAITIIPYLVAMLTAIAMLRSSGVLNLLTDACRWISNALAWDDRFIDALPTALIKPFSGSGARAMMLSTMQQFGADSFAGRLACIIQGSTETTFYIIAVYYGAIKIKYIRHTAACGIIADLFGAIAAIFVTYWFFG